MNPLVEEVKAFLDGLRRELPETFAPEPPRGLGREEAHRIFTERAAHWSRLMGVGFGKIRVKDQRTLWGSCSREGNLNFNWRVATAPAEVVDYLVVHELAHRLEMNHSSRFWAHVGRFCPDHKAHRRWLRENGRRLQGRRAG